jgi:hypothetical protein
VLDEILDYLHLGTKEERVLRSFLTPGPVLDATIYFCKAVQKIRRHFLPGYATFEYF